jgi:hypothetical protein
VQIVPILPIPLIMLNRLNVPIPPWDLEEAFNG